MLKSTLFVGEICLMDAVHFFCFLLGVRSEGAAEGGDSFIEERWPTPQSHNALIWTYFAKIRKKRRRKTILQFDL